MWPGQEWLRACSCSALCHSHQRGDQTLAWGHLCWGLEQDVTGGVQAAWLQPRYWEGEKLCVCRPCCCGTLGKAAALQSALILRRAGVAAASLGLVEGPKGPSLRLECQRKPAASAV